MTRRAVVTGGVSGLGAATVERLAADGVQTITVDVADGADVILDISDAAAVRAAAAEIGPVDIVINSAGIVGPNRPFWDVDEEEWKRTFAVNVDGTFNVCRAFAPAMIRSGWGRIVNFASMAGKDGNPNMVAYSATKAAVIGMTKTMGKDLAEYGVLVNAIAPAVVSTPMNASTAPDVLAHITSLIPMKRVGRADEVAELVAWLASDKCSFSTGAVYDISGGRATY
ncbi:SDR family oxidoreductase [Ruania alkalisoli]|uniref:SDR family oxidoreductase n=1 Tax=Ruania alkalisoli TaxID=2779775 RepID=A0A7M1SXQ9_9MICO|nr:SDR family NAD(P)-dependent oxidoreductase [Ruania alkalisoli]QOR71817.1 SDR family oxidoreductase [Ruania alkalisoli]